MKIKKVLAIILSATLAVGMVGIVASAAEKEIIEAWTIASEADQGGLAARADIDEDGNVTSKRIL